MITCYSTNASGKGCISFIMIMIGINITDTLLKYTYRQYSVLYSILSVSYLTQARQKKQC